MIRTAHDAPVPATLTLMWRARGVRFLLLLLGGWALARALVLVAGGVAASPALLLPPPVPMAAPRPLPWPVAPRAVSAAPEPVTMLAPAPSPPSPPMMSLNTLPIAASAAIGPVPALAAAAPPLLIDNGYAIPGHGRHALRRMLFGLDLPDVAPAAFAAVPGESAIWLTGAGRAATSVLAATAPSHARSGNRWSLSAWALARPAGGGGGGLAPAGQIGGSQAGVRIARQIADGRLSAHLRLTSPLASAREAEAAVGATWQPWPGVPVSLSLERRIAVGPAARGGLAVGAFGGVGDVSLPLGFRLDAYGQAGVVGTTRRTPYVDASASVVRDVVAVGPARLSAGFAASGAAQPGAARLDIGPRATLGLPVAGGAARVTLDWRERVAGSARPGSGPALTIATDF